MQAFHRKTETMKLYKVASASSPTGHADGEMRRPMFSDISNMACSLVQRTTRVSCRSEGWAAAKARNRLEHVITMRQPCV